MEQSKVSATLIDPKKIEIEVKGNAGDICYLVESMIRNMLEYGFPEILLRAAILRGIEKYEDSEKGKMQDVDKAIKDAVDTLIEGLVGQYDKN